MGYIWEKNFMRVYSPATTTPPPKAEEKKESPKEICKPKIMTGTPHVRTRSIYKPIPSTDPQQAVPPVKPKSTVDDSVYIPRGCHV